MAAQRESLEQQYKKFEEETREQVRKSLPALEENIRRKATEAANAEDPNTDCTVEMVLAGDCATTEPCDKDYKYDRDAYDCNEYTATVDKDLKVTKALRALESFRSPKLQQEI